VTSDREQRRNSARAFVDKTVRLELRVGNAAAVLDAVAARGYPVHDSAIAPCGMDIAVS